VPQSWARRSGSDRRSVTFASPGAPVSVSAGGIGQSGGFELIANLPSGTRGPTDVDPVVVDKFLLRMGGQTIDGVFMSFQLPLPRSRARCEGGREIRFGAIFDGAVRVQPDKVPDRGA
jgi:hypothetical protein